jgi:hypothetical protein
MSMIEKLSRVFLGADEADTKEEAVPRLRRFYVGAAQRARQLAHHAELAPHEAGRTALQHLAGREQALADGLRRKILELGGFPGEAPPPPEPLGTLNYWSRLLHDLEGHREAVRQLLEEVAERTDDRPDLAEYLRGLARDEADHAEVLRDLIARSDPQALD